MMASRVSHVRIQASSISSSTKFYKALGLQAIGTNDEMMKGGQYCLLRSPLTRFLKQPFILLEQRKRSKDHDGNEDLPDAASVLGIARMCLLVRDVKALVYKLGHEHSIFPIAKSIDGKLPNSEDDIHVAAFRDPDGNIVELLSFQKQNALVSLLSSYVYPLVLHVNVNVTNYAASLEAFKQLGYGVSQDYGRFGDGNLHKALAVPDPGIAAHVSLLKLPSDRLFVLELMEWESPKPAITEIVGVPPVVMGLVVDNVDSFVETLVTSKDTNDRGWRLSQTSKRIKYPFPIGSVMVATILDPNGMPIELISRS